MTKEKSSYCKKILKTVVREITFIAGTPRISGAACGEHVHVCSREDDGACAGIRANVRRHGM